MSVLAHKIELTPSKLENIHDIVHVLLVIIMLIGNVRFFLHFLYSSERLMHFFSFVLYFM